MCRITEALSKLVPLSKQQKTRLTDRLTKLLIELKKEAHVSG